MTIADVLILIGATAVGLSMARAVMDTQILTWWYTYLIVGGTPILATWTITLLVLRLRSPRPAPARLYRQPGAAAVLAASPTVAIWAGIVALWWLRGNTSRAFNRFSYIGVGGGSSVLGVWFYLMLAGLLRYERGWVDRAGRALGLSWIALMFLIFYHEFL